MQGLSHGVVRVDSDNSLTSLTLQDCGQVLPTAQMVVVKMDGVATLCKTDEVGELCLAAPYVGQGYWGLEGVSNNQFKVRFYPHSLVVYWIVYRHFLTFMYIL